MGMFDEVTMSCPNKLCRRVIIVQSKASRCELRVIPIETAPESILDELSDEKFLECSGCKTKFVVEFQVVKQVVLREVTQSEIDQNDLTMYF